MKKYSLILPLFMALVLLGAGCAQTDEAQDSATDEVSDESSQDSSGRRPYGRGGQANEADEDTAEEGSDSGSEDADATASDADIQELEDLADDIDELLGGMDAGESGF